MSGKPKIVTEVIRRYYVQSDDWILGGPFDTKEEARECLEQIQKTAERDSAEK